MLSYTTKFTLSPALLTKSMAGSERNVRNTNRR
jgi:hypothetical protein